MSQASSPYDLYLGQTSGQQTPQQQPTTSASPYESYMSSTGGASGDADPDADARAKYNQSRWEQPGAAYAASKYGSGANLAAATQSLKDTLPAEMVAKKNAEFDADYDATKFVKQRENVAEAVAQQYVANAKQKGIDPTQDPNGFQSGMYAEVHQKLAQYGLDPDWSGSLPAVAINMDGTVKKTHVSDLWGLGTAVARGFYAIKQGLVDAPAQLAVAGAAIAYDQFNGPHSSGGGVDMAYNPIRTGLNAMQNQQRDVMSALPQSTSAQNGGWQGLVEGGLEQIPNVVLLSGLGKLGSAGSALMHGSMFAQGANQTYQSMMQAGKEAGLTDTEASNRAMGAAVIDGAVKTYLFTRYGAVGSQGAGASRLTNAVLGAVGQAGAGGGANIIDAFSRYAATGKVDETMEQFIHDIEVNAIGGGMAGAVGPVKKQAQVGNAPAADVEQIQGAASTPVTPFNVVKGGKTDASTNAGPAGTSPVKGIKNIGIDDDVIGNGIRVTTGAQVQVLGTGERGTVLGMADTSGGGDTDYNGSIAIKLDSDGSVIYRSPQLITDAKGGPPTQIRNEPNPDEPPPQPGAPVVASSAKQLLENAPTDSGVVPEAEQAKTERLRQEQADLQARQAETQRLIDAANQTPEPMRTGNGTIEEGEEVADQTQHGLTAPTEEEFARQQQRMADFETQKKGVADAAVKAAKESGKLVTAGTDRDIDVSLASMQTQLKRDFGIDSTITHVEPESAQQKFAATLAEKLGLKVAFFKGDQELPVGGSSSADMPNVININHEARAPVLEILGHELTHAFRKLSADTYSKILDAIQQHDPNSIQAGMEKYYQGMDSEVVKQRLKDNPLTWREEGAASVMQEAFTRREFWDRLAQRDPGLLGSAIKTVVAFVKRVEQMWAGIPGLVKKPELLTRLADIVSEYSDKVSSEKNSTISVDTAEGGGRVVASSAKQLLEPAGNGVSVGEGGTERVEGPGGAQPPTIPESSTESIGEARKVAPAKATSFDQVKVKQATGLTPQSSEAADLFNRAFQDKLTPEDENAMGLAGDGAGTRKQQSNAFRLSLVSEIQDFHDNGPTAAQDLDGTADDAKAMLAASFVGVLKRDAKMMLGDRATPEAIQDAIQSGLQALTQQLSGERRAKAEREQGPKIMDFDPGTQDNVHKFLYPAMYRAMQKAIFPRQGKEIGPEGVETTVQRPDILQTSGQLPATTKGEEVLPAGGAKSVLDSLVDSESQRDTLKSTDKVPPKSIGEDINATLKSRGGVIEGYDGERAIVKLSPTGKPSIVSTSPDAPNLYRSKEGQLEVYNANGDYYARPFGSEGGFRRLPAEDAASLDAAAQEGKLLPPVADIAKVFDAFGQGTPDINYMPQKVGPGEDPDEVRVMLGKVQAEKAPSKTLGRPELANPAQGANRDVVTAVDELRKQGGVPAVKPDTQTQIEAGQINPDTLRAKLKGIAEGKGGQLTDAETFAAKDMVDEDAQKILKGGARADMIDAAKSLIGYRQARTEAARALRAGFDENMTPAQRFSEYLNRAMVPKPKIGPEGPGSVTPEQVVDEATRIRDTLKPIGIDLDNITPEQLADRNWLDRTMREIQSLKSTKADVAYEYWRNAILSGTLTPVRKIISDTAQTIWDFAPQRMVEAMTNQITGSKEGAQLGEFKHILAGVWPGLQNASRNFIRGFSQEVIPYQDEITTEAGEGMLDKADAMTGHPGGVAIGGTLGRIVRLPTRTLRAIDAFYTTLDAHMQVGAEAYRSGKAAGLEGDQLAAHMHDEMSDLASNSWQDAVEKANNLTFKNQSKLSNMATALKDNIPAGRWIIPFTKTPANIFATGFRKSPLGSIPLAAGVVKDLVTMKPGEKEWTYLRSDAGSRALAEQTMAWAGMIALSSLAKSGLITGSGTSQAEEKEGEREFKARVAPPESIKIGGKWYSYANIEPFGTSLGIGVNLLNRWNDVKQTADVGKAMGGTMQDMVGLVRDKTFVKGLGDIIRATEDPAQGIPRAAANFATSWVPNIIRSGIRATQDTEPDTKIGGTGVEWTQALLKHAANEAIPGAYSQPPKVDLWGREQKKSSPTGSYATDVLWRMLVPVKTQESDKATKLDRLILNYNNAHPDAQFYPAPPPRSFKRSDGTLQVPPKLYEQFAQKAGQMSARILENMQLNADNPSSRDMKILREVISKSRVATAASLFGAAKMSTEMSDEYMKARQNNEEFAPP